MEDKTTGQRRRFGKGRSLIAVGLAMVLLVVAFTVPVGAHKNKRTVRISGASNFFYSGYLHVKKKR